MSDKTSMAATCKVELVHINYGIRHVLKDTINIYRSACTFAADVVNENWESLSQLGTAKERLSAVEKLIHKTKDNDPVYPKFDEKFYKFPPYDRRSVINYVLGQISSYCTRLKDYQTRRHDAVSIGIHFSEKPPVLNMDSAPCPSMYKKEMYELDDKCVGKIRWSGSQNTLPSFIMGIISCA